jgi:hypothetical protein
VRELQDCTNIALHSGEQSKCLFTFTMDPDLPLYSLVAWLH